MLSIRREKWQPSLYSRLCSNHFTESCYKIRPGAEVKLLRDDAIPTIFSFTDHLNTKASAQRALMGKKLNNTTINDSRTRNDSVESLSLEGNLSSNQPGGKVVHSILADHPYCSNILHEKNENLREQIKQGIPLMRRKMLKPTLHDIYKSQRYQPKVILHRLSKSVFDHYINKVYEPCYVKCETETSARAKFNTCEALSKTSDTEEEKLTINKCLQWPLKHKIPSILKAANTINDKSWCTLGKNRMLASSAKYRISSFLSSQRSQKSKKIKSHLTFVENPIFPGTNKPCKVKPPTSFLKYTDKFAANSNNKQRNKIPVTTETSKAAKVVQASNTAYFATTLHQARCPAIQLCSDIVKESNETVKDASVVLNRLLVPMTSPETRDHLEIGEINSELVHAIKEENIDMNMCCKKSKTFLSEEKMDRRATEELFANISTLFETDWFQNNSEHSHSGSELSLSSNPRPWLTPKIVSVSSLAAQSEGNSEDIISPSATEGQSEPKEICSSRSFIEVNSTNVKQSNVPKISIPLSLQTYFELYKIANDLGINNLFSRLSIIIKDSVQESEHYNENAKYILQLISTYSREEKKTPIE